MTKMKQTPVNLSSYNRLLWNINIRGCWQKLKSRKMLLILTFSTHHHWQYCNMCDLYEIKYSHKDSLVKARQEQNIRESWKSDKIKKKFERWCEIGVGMANKATFDFFWQHCRSGSWLPDGYQICSQIVKCLHDPLPSLKLNLVCFFLCW